MLSSWNKVVVVIIIIIKSEVLKLVYAFMYEVLKLDVRSHEVKRKKLEVGR